MLCSAPPHSLSSSASHPKLAPNWGPNSSALLPTTEPLPVLGGLWVCQERKNLLWVAPSHKYSTFPHAWQHRKAQVAAASAQTRDGDSRKAGRGRESCRGTIMWGYVCLRITLWPHNCFCSRSLCSFTFHICNFLQEGTQLSPCTG